MARRPALQRCSVAGIHRLVAALRSAAFLGLGCCLVLCAGCAVGPRIARTVVHPAEAPIGIGARVWLVPEGDVDGARRIARRLAPLLRSGDGAPEEVLVLDRDAYLERLGAAPPGTIAATLRLHIRIVYEHRWRSVPERVCGPRGCYTRNRTMNVQEPVLRGRLFVDVINPRDRSVMQQLLLESRLNGESLASGRLAILRFLFDKASRALLGRREEVAVQFWELDEGQNAGDLAFFQSGNWDDGIAALRRALPGAEANTAGAALRFNLAQALCFAGRGDETRDQVTARFAEVDELFREALALEPLGFVERAANRCRELRQGAETLAGHRRAAVINRRFGEGPALSAPQAPEAYR